MIALMASYGLAVIKDKQVRRFIVLCAVISSLLLSLFFYLPFLQKMSASNIQDAGMFLNSISSEEIEVLTISSEGEVINSAVTVPLLDLFTNKRLKYNYTPDSVSSDDIGESSLRFTWDYRNPEYYIPEAVENEKRGTLVVITSESGQDEPEYIKGRRAGLSLKTVFDRSTDIFSYVTEVRVYQ
jgi:hypothetical protein